MRFPDLWCEKPGTKMTGLPFFKWSCGSRVFGVCVLTSAVVLSLQLSGYLYSTPAQKPVTVVYSQDQRNAKSLALVQAKQFQTQPLKTYEGSDPKKPFLDVICVFPLLDSAEFSKSRYSNVSKATLSSREEEYIYSLRANIKHSAVANLHLFTHKPQLLYDRLTTKYDIDMSRVIIYNCTENPTYAELFGYASRVLIGRFVMILNADNYLGQGFTDLDLNYLRTSRIMYSLTRRLPVPFPPGCQQTEPSHCETKSAYLGSHDSFLFFVDSPLPQAFLKELEFPSHVFGSENVVIWAFQRILNFAVLNPCRKVHIHHLHCSGLRASGRVRVNNGGKSGTSGFTDTLYVKQNIRRNKSRLIEQRRLDNMDVHVPFGMASVKFHCDFLVPAKLRLYIRDGFPPLLELKLPYRDNLPKTPNEPLHLVTLH